jgi:HD-GYP domain-containing protein (c-di-GMP phosphodiesterase class II)
VRGSGPLIRSSHERIDGDGYPDGLAGEDIPFGSRIIAVCDAMTSDRPYQPSIGVDAALEELTRHAGGQFDAKVVEAFRRDTTLHQKAADQPHARIIGASAEA